MEVVCEHCKAKMNIPDEKLPKGQMVSIHCPKCKNKISIDMREPEEEKAPAPEQESESAPESTSDAEGESYSYDDFTDDESVEYFDEDAKLALIMEGDPGRSDKIKAAFEELEYKYIETSSIREAIGKLRFHQFHLIMLSDGFDGQEIGPQNPILKYLNQMAMSTRRKTFFALLSDKFKTMDNMMAYAQSANLVISTKDMDKLAEVLDRAIADNEKFYKVFMDTLVEVGRA